MLKNVSLTLEKITKITDVLEVLNTLIHSIVRDKIEIGKDTLSDIQTCLQNAQDKIEILQLESQLQ